MVVDAGCGAGRASWRSEALRPGPAAGACAHAAGAGGAVAGFLQRWVASGEQRLLVVEVLLEAVPARQCDAVADRGGVSAVKGAVEGLRDCGHDVMLVGWGAAARRQERTRAR